MDEAIGCASLLTVNESTGDAACFQNSSRGAVLSVKTGGKRMLYGDGWRLKGEGLGGCFGCRGGDTFFQRMFFRIT